MTRGVPLAPLRDVRKSAAEIHRHELRVFEGCKAKRLFARILVHDVTPFVAGETSAARPAPAVGPVPVASCFEECEQVGVELALMRNG